MSVIRMTISNADTEQPRNATLEAWLMRQQSRNLNKTTYLDDVNPANTSLFANLIKSDEERKAVCILFALDTELDWQTLLEGNGNIDDLVRCVPWINCSSPHVVWRRDGWIL